MEKLDIYDEYMNFVGSENRDIVHQKGLWHKTVHCWLYDKSGNIYFQIRKDSEKLYTTASGHVLANETVKDAFSREVFEEIGAKVDISNATMVEINAWRMDKVKNGVPFIDRAFANVYINEIDENYNNFVFDETEVLGVVKVNATNCLALLKNEIKNVDGVKITKTNTEKISLNINDFWVMNGEIALLKYGKILQSIINIKG